MLCKVQIIGWLDSRPLHLYSMLVGCTPGSLMYSMLCDWILLALGRPLPSWSRFQLCKLQAQLQQEKLLQVSLHKHIMGPLLIHIAKRCFAWNASPTLVLPLSLRILPLLMFFRQQDLVMLPNRTSKVLKCEILFYNQMIKSFKFYATFQRYQLQ